MNEPQFILWSTRGGWFTKSATYHSDYREARTFTEEEALEMAAIHSGRLIPTNLAHMQQLMKGVKP